MPPLFWFFPIHLKKMPPLIERRSISITPLQISSPMAEKIGSKQTHKKMEKPTPTPMGSLKNFFSCKYHQNVVESVNNNKKKKKRKKKKETRVKRESSKVSNETNGNGVVTPTHSSSSSSSSSNLSDYINSSASSSSSFGGSFRGMHLRKISGCYECHFVVDPVTGVSRVSSLGRSVVFPCSECGEIFTKSEGLELHQSIQHAVSELGPEANSRNIVEIIFKSSWLKKQPPSCNIIRILKIHHSQKSLSKFESYRDSIKQKSTKPSKKNPRCIADGNELLRFHCTTLNCNLGLHGSKSLCISTQNCRVCGIIRNGFEPDEFGKIRTMNTSGRAHETAKGLGIGKERTMLVCRVIAGRVKKNQEEVLEEFDSVCDGLDELFVFDPRAILPCFAVIYNSL